MACDLSRVSRLRSSRGSQSRARSGPATHMSTILPLPLFPECCMFSPQDKSISCTNQSTLILHSLINKVRKYVKKCFSKSAQGLQVCLLSGFVHEGRDARAPHTAALAAAYRQSNIGLYRNAPRHRTSPHFRSPYCGPWSLTCLGLIHSTIQFRFGKKYQCLLYAENDSVFFTATTQCIFNF